MQRAPHPLAAFADGLVRQADNGKLRQARRGLHLHVDIQNVNALKGNGINPGDHGLKPPLNIQGASVTGTKRER